MKILVCARCGDWVKLRSEPRTCPCGGCGGRYVDDVKAQVWGRTSFFIVAIRNSEFPHAGMGTWNLLALDDPEADHVEQVSPP